MKKVIIALSVLYLIRNYFYREIHEYWFRIDFKEYYDFAAYGIRNNWLYKDWTSIIWKPFTLLPFEIAFIVWYIISTLCVLIIVKKLLEKKYGWIFVLPCIKIAGWSLGVGNIMPILAAACLTPLGCLAAGLVKPHLLCIIAIHAFVRFRCMEKSNEFYISRSRRDLLVCDNNNFEESHTMEKAIKFIYNLVTLPVWAVCHLREISKEQKRRETEYQKTLNATKGTMKRL